MTKLIIARHGNTFDPEDIPTRVGARTDLPLVSKGKKQAEALGRHLKDAGLIPDVAYSSTLMRTKESAEIALRACGVSLPVYALDIFNEIDYGPDENKPEDDVIARIGKEAIERWDKHAIVPQGWAFAPDTAIRDWIQFAHHITKTNDTVTDVIHDMDETILVVTSNGIARFAPHITDDFDSFSAEHSIKLSTGAYGLLEFKKRYYLYKVDIKKYKYK